MRRARVALIALTALTSAAAGAQESQPLAERGASLYANHCAPCHASRPEGSSAPMLPGVQSLSLKYGGSVSPYIEERRDLANAEVLKLLLREGAGSMPPFRKTEVSDEDIAAIAAYLAQTSSDSVR